MPGEYEPLPPGEEEGTAGTYARPKQQPGAGGAGGAPPTEPAPPGGSGKPTEPVDPRQAARKAYQEQHPGEPTPYDTREERLQVARERMERLAASVPKLPAVESMETKIARIQTEYEKQHPAKTETERQRQEAFRQQAQMSARLATPPGAQEAKQTGIIAAETIVPSVSTVRHWNKMSVAERALSIALDVVSFVPLVGAAGRAARATTSLSRMARMEAAGRAVIAEAKAQMRAPVDIIIHPVGTIKATGKELINLGENIAHPRKIPEAVITTSEGTVRLPITKSTTAKEALEARDALATRVAKGERPLVRVGDHIYELRQSPFMKATGGGLAHTTPQGEGFERGLIVAKKPGMSLSEQGLFVSPEPLPRFASASAFGKTGEKPAIIIMSPETARKAIATQKIYRGTAEMELKFRVGTKIPAPKQRLFTRVGPEGRLVEMWLEKPLPLIEIAKLKGQAVVEWFKAPFQTPLKIKNLAGKRLTPAETKELVGILNKSGNEEQARNLQRAEQLLYRQRRAPPSLERILRMRGPNVQEQKRQPGRQRPSPHEQTAVQKSSRLELARRASGRTVSRGPLIEAPQRVSVALGGYQRGNNLINECPPHELNRRDNLASDPHGPNHQKENHHARHPPIGLGHRNLLISRSPLDFSRHVHGGAAVIMKVR